jgi:hypothetical protein
LCTAACWAGIALAVLVVPLLALVPGLLAATALSFLTPDERAAAAGGFGFAFLGLSAFVAHLSGADPLTVNAALWVAAVAAGAAVLLISRRRPWSAVSWPPLGLWALFYVTLIGFQGLTPVYAGGSWYGDWWEHYAIAQVYLGTGTGYSTVWFGDYNLASRTPLFNLAAAFALSVFGDRFWVYQVASTFLNSLFLVPRYLLARTLCGVRAALLCAGLVFFDTWLVHQGTFTWTKLSCAYLLLLALGFSIRFRATGDIRLLYTSALCGALAFMAHQTAAYYVGALLVEPWLFRPRPRVSGRQVAVVAAIVAAVIAPWYFWVSQLYGMVGAVQAAPTLSLGEPTVRRLLRGGALNAVTSILPVPFIDFLRTGGFTWEEALGPLVRLYSNPLVGALPLTVVAAIAGTWRRPSPTFVLGFHHLKGPALALVFGASLLLALMLGQPRYARAWSGPGPLVWAYGIALVVLGAWTLWRRPKDTSMAYTPHLTAIVFALAGYGGALLVHPGGDVDGVAQVAMVPSVLVALAYATARVATLPRWGQRLVMAGVVAEFALTWVLLANLIAGAPPFDSDDNRRLKSDHELAFLYDVAGGNWTAFALIALGGQVGGVVLLTRMRTATTTTTATTIDRRDYR